MKHPWPTDDDVAQAARGDRAAVARVIRGMEGSVRWAVARYARHTHFTPDELESEAQFAIFYALRSFRPELGAWHTYALRWMRARLHRFIAGNTKRKHAAVIVSTETQLGEDFTLADTLTADVEAQDDSYEAAERAHAVRRLVALLRNDLDRQAIEGRLRGETLQTIGDKLGVSREYVRQVEARAHRRLRKLVAASGVA